MGRFFTNRTAGRFFPGGPQRTTAQRQKLVFTAQADLPENGICTKIGFVPDGQGALDIYTYHPGSGWVLANVGGGGTMSFPQEEIAAIAAQYAYPVTANGGDVDSPAVIGTYAFRNGVLLFSTQYTLSASTFTLNGGEIAPVNGETFTIILAVLTP